MVSVIIATLFVTPYLVALAPRLARFIERRAPAAGDTAGVSEGRSAHVVLVGFGPAGHAVAAHLRNENTPLVLIEWNPALARRADAIGIDDDHWRCHQNRRIDSRGCEYGECRRHHRARSARPARTITAHARAAARDAMIVTRSRYQRWNDLLASGATSVLDEGPGLVFRWQSSSKRHSTQRSSDPLNPLGASSLRTTAPEFPGRFNRTVRAQLELQSSSRFLGYCCAWKTALTRHGKSVATAPWPRRNDH